VSASLIKAFINIARQIATFSLLYDKVSAMSPANLLLKWCRCERK